MANQVSGLLSPMLRRQRLAAAAGHLRQGRVLDFGCADGELAGFIEPERYLGVDCDREALERARARHPSHTLLTVEEFEALADETFDVIAALALIEHLPAPGDWLRLMRRRLRPGGRLVLTTPRPGLRWVHELGARLGLFSMEAAEEHQRLLGRRDVEALAGPAGLRLKEYRPFQLRCNQLFVLEVQEAAEGTAMPAGQVIGAAHGEVAR
jgi:SAM-dependent methyltransferase